MPALRLQLQSMLLGRLAAHPIGGSGGLLCDATRHFHVDSELGVLRLLFRLECRDFSVAGFRDLCLRGLLLLLQTRDRGGSFRASLFQGVGDCCLSPGSDVLLGFLDP